MNEPRACPGAVPASGWGGAVAVTTATLVLVVLATTAAVGGGISHGAATESAQEGDIETALAQEGDIETALAQDIDADSVVLAADIQADGDADWRVTYRLALDTEERETAFEELQMDIEANQSAYLAPFEERMRTTAADASNATDREMTVGAFTIETERESQPQGAFGLVTFRFEWTGFAAVDGDTIRAGDALDRLILGADERLQMSWPSAHTLESSSPEADTVEEERIVWRGPVDFDTGQPRVELVSADESDTALVLVALAAVGFAIAVAVVGWRLRRQTDETAGAGTAASSTGGDGEPGGAGAASADAGAGGSGGEDSTAATGAGAATAGENDGPPPELLSNEEQVLQLLDANGGRMKQQAVADQLDWTAAKTSQVVSDLREADEVESFRLGRENVLTLPDVSIEADAEEGEGDA